MAEGVILASFDGLTWKHTGMGPGSSLTGVAYDGGQCNRAGSVLFAYGAGNFIAAGEGGTLMTATVCGARFPDVAAGYPACDAVEQLAERQIAAGHPDGTFRPDTALTRAEVAKMLALTLGLKPDPQGRLPFSDSTAHWAARDGYRGPGASRGLSSTLDSALIR